MRLYIESQKKKPDTNLILATFVLAKNRFQLSLKCIYCWTMVLYALTLCVRIIGRLVRAQSTPCVPQNSQGNPIPFL
jgi:hypothetical protein